MCLRTQWLEEVEHLGETHALAERFAPDSIYRLWNPDNIQLANFEKLVNKYHQRQLSFEEDVVDAFRGIAMLHTPIFGSLLYDSVEAFFDPTMCWQPSSEANETFRRRQATITKQNISSWS